MVRSVLGYMGAIVGAVVFFMVAVLGSLYYFIKVKKVATEEEHIDYNVFRRLDATEYCKFKDIVSSGDNDGTSPGMVVMGNNTFVGGIEVQGYNYFAASAEERERTMINTIAFFNIVEQPIQMHQTVRAIDISHNIARETEYAKDIEMKMLSLRDEYAMAAEALEQNIDNTDVYRSIENKIKKLGRSIRSLEWQLKESKEIIYYMEQVSDAKRNMKKVNQILFSYVYNPDEDVEDLTEAQIYLRAENELRTQAEIYGGALENCGCSWHMLSSNELIDLLRRHYHPETADDQRLEEILNSSYSALYVSSDSLRELERERLAEEAYAEQMRILEEEQRKAIDAARLRAEATKAEMWQEVAAVNE